MRYATANDIINRAVVEIGLRPDVDPVASLDETFVQMTALLNVAGNELRNLHAWQQFRGIVDATLDSGSANVLLGNGVTVNTGGVYDLPDDFDSMLDQTGWDRSNNLPVGGPLSAQDWTYLQGRDLVSQTIYASFRLAENKLYLFPQPAPEGLRITFEYLSNYWVIEAGNSRPTIDRVDTGSDVIAYDAILIKAMLKLKFLNAKGLPAQDAALEFDTMLQSRMAKNEGAPVLSAGNNRRGMPYLDPYRNTGDTNYGSV